MTNRRPSVPNPPKPIEPENQVFKIGQLFDRYWFFMMGFCAGIAFMMVGLSVFFKCQ